MVGEVMNDLCNPENESKFQIQCCKAMMKWHHQDGGIVRRDVGVPPQVAAMRLAVIVVYTATAFKGLPSCMFSSPYCNSCNADLQVKGGRNYPGMFLIICERI